ncbi:hypothetical protein BaRGS_00028767 [Batillaria attramentaria]|uniref:Uncharacterized protein n=1 Tax=Batillaria attramentaria TaxID=370345 RepID=A0ABD0JYG3_9CAEN
MHWSHITFFTRLYLTLKASLGPHRLTVKTSVGRLHTGHTSLCPLGYFSLDPRDLTVKTSVGLPTRDTSLYSLGSVFFTVKTSLDPRDLTVQTSSVGLHTGHTTLYPLGYFSLRRHHPMHAISLSRHHWIS